MDPSSQAEVDGQVSLSSVQKVKEYIQKYFCSETYPNTIYNGYLIYQAEFNRLSYKDIADYISKHCILSVNTKALESRIRRVLKEYSSKKRCGLSIPSNQTRLQHFLSERLEIPTLHTQSPDSHSQNSSESTTPTRTSSSHTPPPPQPTIHTTTRSDCAKCCLTRQDMNVLVKQTQEDCNKKIDQLTEQISLLKTRYNTKYTNQYKKRKHLQLEQKDNQITEFRKEIKSLKLLVDTLTTSVSNLETENSALKKDNLILSRENTQFTSKLKDQRQLEKKNRDLEAQVHFLLATQEADREENVSISSKKDGKQYSLQLRKVVYFFLLHNIPVEAIGPVIVYIFRSLTNTTITHTPSPITCSQMMRELGVLSDLQSVETVLNSSSCCISWDATTLSGSHPNELHINTPESSLTLNIRSLPGGRAADYAQHIINTLEEVSSLYAEYSGSKKEDILLSLQGKILSTLTDRVAANHATVVLLEDYLGRSLLELNCQIHPLDGLANAARKLLRAIETEQRLATKSFGSGCQVENVLHLISKLRYKAKGDPSGFKAHLRGKNLPCGLFVRYVGNRLHVLFHLAGTVYRHRDILLEYAKGVCSNKQMAAALKHDLQQPFICLELQALGLLGKMVTGPWMALFYTSVDERRHLELSKYLSCAVDNLQALESQSDVILTTNKDVFGRPLVVDDTLLALRICDDLPTLSSILSRVIGGFLDVLKRQLARYIFGDLANPSEDQIKAACAAPVHNIWAERTLGLYDAQHRRAPNATDSFLDSKCKATVNNTMLWVEKKSPKKQQVLVDFAVQIAAKYRKSEATKRCDLHAEITKRIQERVQNQDMALRRKVAKIMKLSISEGLLQRVAFDSIPFDLIEATAKLIDSIIVSPLSLIGRKITHLWNENGHDVVYLGKVLRMSSKTQSYTISYWMEGEQEDDSVDHKIKFEDLLTDVAFGDFLM